MFTNIIRKILYNTPALLHTSRLLSIAPLFSFASYKQYSSDGSSHRNRRNAPSSSLSSNREEFQQKSSKQKNTPSIIKLWHILQDYKQVIDGVAEVKDVIELCRKISGHSNKQRNSQFKICRQELQKIMSKLTSLPFSDLSLDNHLAILEFLSVIQSLQLLKKQAIVTLKDLVFMHLQPTFQTLETLSINDQCKLYAGLASFNHPSLSILAEQIPITISKLQQVFNPELAELVIMGLNQRSFLSGFDNKLLKAMLQKLQESSAGLSLMSLAKIFYAIESMGAGSLFGEANYLICIDHFNDIFLGKLKKAAFDDPAIIYLTSAHFRCLRQESIFKEIIVKLMLKMKQPEGNTNVLQILIGCLQKTRIPLSEQQIDIIVNFIEKFFKDQTSKSIAFAENSLEVTVLELIQTGAFDSHLKKFNKIVKQARFQPHWTLIATYGVKGFPFPLDKIQAKIKPKTTELNLDANFIKAAVAIGLQRKLYPQSEVLRRSQDAIASSLKQCPWNQRHIEWLGRQSNITPLFLKHFHELYYSLFKSKLQPYAIAKNPRFYQYLVTCENSSTCNKDYLRAMNAKILEPLIERQYWYEVNQFLLFILQHKMQAGVLDLKQLGPAVVRLLQNYSNKVHRSSLETIQIYQKLLIQILHAYNHLKAMNIATEFNQALKRMLVPPKTSLYHNSDLQMVLLNQCLRIIEYINDTDLVAIIIRLAIAKKGLKTVPSKCKFNKAYFTDQQLEKLGVDRS